MKREDLLEFFEQQNILQLELLLNINLDNDVLGQFYELTLKQQEWLQDIMSLLKAIIQMNTSQSLDFDELLMQQSHEAEYEAALNVAIDIYRANYATQQQFTFGNIPMLPDDLSIDDSLDLDMMCSSSFDPAMDIDIGLFQSLDDSSDETILFSSGLYSEMSKAPTPPFFLTVSLEATSVNQEVPQPILENKRNATELIREEKDAITLKSKDAGGDSKRRRTERVSKIKKQPSSLISSPEESPLGHEAPRPVVKRRRRGIVLTEEEKSEKKAKSNCAVRESRRRKAEHVIEMEKQLVDLKDRYTLTQAMIGFFKATNQQLNQELEWLKETEKLFEGHRK